MRSPASAGAACLQQLIEQWRAKQRIWDRCNDRADLLCADVIGGCADELDACRGSLVAALQQIEKEMDKHLRGQEMYIGVTFVYGPSAEQVEDWRDQLADLRTHLEGTTR